MTGTRDNISPPSSALHRRPHRLSLPVRGPRPPAARWLHYVRYELERMQRDMRILANILASTEGEIEKENNIA